MPSVGTLTLHEYNDETIIVTLYADVNRTVPLDLTGTLVQFVYKTTASQSDDDAIIIIATIDDPVQGLCTVEIGNEQVELARKFFRIDVLSGPERKTAIYGPITVVDL